jgi:dienelactone hydrolase
VIALALLTLTIRQALFVPDPLPPLNERKHGQFEPEPGIIAEKVSYSTAYGLRVPAVVYRPAKMKDRAPALIVVNGHGGDKQSWYAFYSGIVYARAGAVVLTYDPIGEGERNSERKSGTRSHDKLVEPEEMARRMGGLMQTDVMQAASYLSSRADVDSKRIGAMGYSMGSFVLSIACAHESRIKACVLVGGGNLDGADGYWDRSKPMCQGGPYKALQFLGDRPAAIYAMHARRGATLLYNGLADSVVNMHRIDPPAFFAELRERAGASFDVGFEPNVSHRPYFVTKPVALWLEKQLDFPRWNAKDIKAMPVTHIGEWARERGVEMDKGYAAEDREGGTPAIGVNVPGIKPERLRVFSEQEWRQSRDRLTWEAWVTRAKAAADRTTRSR